MDSVDWQAEANLNTARGYVSGWGTQSDAGAAGGPPANTDYEEYNGSSWTTKTFINYSLTVVRLGERLVLGWNSWCNKRAKW